MVKPIPDGYHTLIPYLVVPDGNVMQKFLQETFNARLIARHDLPDGTMMHAEFEIGDSKLMMGQANAMYGPRVQNTHVYVADVDAIFTRAISAGARVIRPVENQFYGDRNCGFEDPAGNWWWVSTHVEDVSAEELQRRMMAGKKTA